MYTKNFVYPSLLILQLFFQVTNVVYTKNFVYPSLVILQLFLSGQKCCVHVHGVFPYILLNFDTPASPEVINELRGMVNKLVGRKDNRIAAGETAVYSIEPLFTKSFFIPIYVTSLFFYLFLRIFNIFFSSLMK